MNTQSTTPFSTDRFQLDVRARAAAPAASRTPHIAACVLGGAAATVLTFAGASATCPPACDSQTKPDGLAGQTGSDCGALPTQTLIAMGAVASPDRPLVELAICLDTSGSMQGLIDTARARIWDIVSDLATANPAPRLRVALITFGNDGHDKENGWTKVDLALTEDLDSVSMQLFALSTNGGTELVGRAVDSATRSLDWTPGDKVLRLIVVAGNESADQDATVKYADASRRAIEKGIMVNSIYCGDPSDELAPAWREVATLADGKFAAINQAQGAVAIATPFDAELAQLSGELNTTYVAYGARGAWHAENQTAQDSNAQQMAPAAAAARCVAKSGSTYDNRQWDLVDASREPDFKLEDVKTDELPECMRTMTLDQRRTYLTERAKERETLQARVKSIGAERAKFIAEAQAKEAQSGARFESVIRDAVREQARSKGMVFPEISASATN